MPDDKYEKYMARPRTEKFNKDLIMQMTQNVITNMMTGAGTMATLFKKKTTDLGEAITVNDQLMHGDDNEEAKSLKRKSMSRGSSRPLFSGRFGGADTTDSKTLTPLPTPPSIPKPKTKEELLGKDFMNL